MAETDSDVAGGGTESPEPDPGDRTELERLRAEVEQLRSQEGHQARRRRLSWRAPVSVLLITLGCILAPLSVVGVWGANQISDTNRFVANMEPLVHDPAIQNTLTDKITNQITSRIDVTAVTKQVAADLSSRGLPRASQALTTFAPSITSAVDGFIHSSVNKVVTSQAFARIWTQSLTVAHEQVVKALSGGGGAVSTSNGQVTIDLGPFIAAAKQDLVARGFTLANNIPSVHPTFVLFSSKELVKAQSAYRFVNALKIVLPILMLLLLGAGVYVARRHRRALIGASLGFAASMLVLGSALLLVRSAYLNTVPASVLPSDAAAALFDTLVRFIRLALRGLLLLGLVVAAAAFLTGPSVTAVRTRAAVGSGLASVRRLAERKGVNTGPAGRWTYHHRNGLRIGVVAIAAVIFVFWGRPTVALVIVLLVIVLVALALIELIGRPPATPEAVGQP